MAETVQSLFQDAKLIYQDLWLPNDGQYGAQMLRMLNRTHTDICEAYAVKTASYDVPLVNGTREYVISEDYKTIYSANYITSSTAQPIVLYETSVDELDIENPGWRTTFTGVPFRYYDWSDSNGDPIVGFDPIPSTPTTAGYPTVRLIVGVRTPLVAGDTLPKSIRNSAVYLDGLLYQWAKYKNKPDLSTRKALYEESFNTLGQYLDRKQRRLPPRQSPVINMGVSSR